MCLVATLYVFLAVNLLWTKKSYKMEFITFFNSLSLSGNVFTCHQENILVSDIEMNLLLISLNALAYNILCLL